jgi:hypothetical protein
MVVMEKVMDFCLRSGYHWSTVNAAEVKTEPFPMGLSSYACFRGFLSTP